MPNTSFEPGESVDVSGLTPVFNGRAASTSVKPGLLLKPSTGTYSNGFDVADAAYGDSNTSEGFIYQCDIPAIHKRSTTAWDKTTAFQAGDAIPVIKHEEGHTYWLKGSSLTVTEGDKIITAANGLVEKQTAHTSTPLPHHTWIAFKSYTSATWIKATYIGITSMFTA